MGPKLEHASVVILAMLGQLAGHYGLWWANGVWQFLPSRSGWLIVIGIALGLLAYGVMLWSLIGFVLLLGKLGVVDLKKYGEKYPGMY